MRALPSIALLLSALSLDAQACDCFPPEMQAKTAQEALRSAKLAVIGRIAEVRGDGRATLVVVRSFKGAAIGTAVELVSDPARCAPPPLQVGETTLVVSFQDAATTCDKHPADHFFVEHFRAAVAAPQ